MGKTSVSGTIQKSEVRWNVTLYSIFPLGVKVHLLRAKTSVESRKEIAVSVFSFCWVNRRRNKKETTTTQNELRNLGTSSSRYVSSSQLTIDFTNFRNSFFRFYKCKSKCESHTERKKDWRIEYSRACLMKITVIGKFKSAGRKFLGRFLNDKQSVV